MNKEILFRGKRVDNDEWVFGDLIASKNKYYIHPQGNSFQVDGVLSRLIVLHEVKSETVGQYTGLTDKNGKKIFTGDIIRYCDEDCYYYPEDCTEFFGEVVQERGAFGIGTQNELPLELENWCNNDNFVSLWEIYWNLNCCDGELPMIEVIGNIYDNPELLYNGD